jgi:hypothetical protein
MKEFGVVGERFDSCRTKTKGSWKTDEGQHFVVGSKLTSLQ